MSEATERVPTRPLIITNKVERRSTRNPIKTPVYKETKTYRKQKEKKTLNETSEVRDIKKLYPTFPFPPLSHAHQSFDPESPPFESLDAPIIEVVEEVEEIIEAGIDSMLYENLVAAIDSPPWNGWEVATYAYNFSNVDKVQIENSTGDAPVLESPKEPEPMYEDITPVPSPEHGIEDEIINSYLPENPDCEIVDFCTLDSSDCELVDGSDFTPIPDDGVIACEWGIDVPVMEFPRCSTAPPTVNSDDVQSNELESMNFSEISEEAIALTEEILYADLPSLNHMTEPDEDVVLDLSKSSAEWEHKTVQEVEPQKVMLSPNSPPHRRLEKPKILNVVSLQTTPRRYLKDRMFFIPEWRALNTNSRTQIPPPGRFPTDWIHAGSKFYSEFYRLKKPLYGTTVEPRFSSKDMSPVLTELRPTGEVYITRYGQRAQIRSATKDKSDEHRRAGQPYYAPVPRAVGPQGISFKEKLRRSKNKQASSPNYKTNQSNYNTDHVLEGVPTEDIPLSCPYWYWLVEKLYYPEVGAAAVPVTSAVDGAECMAFIEANGRVCIIRNGYRIQLLPPF